MKKIHKLTALSLSVLSMATVGLSACKPDDSGDVVGLGKRISEHIYEGTHIYTATETSEDLVKNGRTPYTLVVPSKSTKTLRIAQKEFEDLFKDATGISIPVVKDEDVTSASSGKYISLGRTKLLENSGITIDRAELDRDGHRVVTKGDDVYICGGEDEGTVFGVYSFMKVTFNYETYYLDCMEIDRTANKKLLNYQVTDIPDFKYRAHSSDVTTYNAPAENYDENMFAWRLGYYGKEGNRGYWWLPVHEIIGDPSSPSGMSTNVNRWFPQSVYQDKEKNPDQYHPKWYSDSAGSGKEMQVCFTAHGDPVEYEAMVNEAFEKVKWTLTYYQPGKCPKNPNGKIMSLTHMDNQHYCTCSACSEIIDETGGSNAAVQILFMNDLATRVDNWFNEPNCPGAAWKEDFQLLFFAYNHNYLAPAKYDARQDKYVIINEKYKVHPRVIAWFARNANGQQDFADQDLNPTLKDPLAKWGVVADNIYFWNYGTNFKYFLIPSDTFQYSTGEMYAYHCNQSNKFWFTQYQDGNPCPNSAWHNLKVYLDAKLSWDTSLEQGELIEKWMKAMYKDAAPIMMNFFQSQRAYIRSTLIDKHQIQSEGDGSPDSCQQHLWPIGLIESWLNQIDQAKAAVSKYETTNFELYDRIQKHIEIEAVSPLFLALELYNLNMTAQDKAMYAARLRYDIDWLDISELVVNGQSDETLPTFVAKYE